VAEERPSLQELELRVKEHELKLRETEIRAKERELSTSKWMNPVVIGLFAAVLALIGNIIVTVFNNQNTQEVEHFHTQSTLILEAIKTNGDTNAACKNLIFFASLGLLEDTNHAITGACPGNVQGVPSVSEEGPPDLSGGRLYYALTVKTVDDNGAPLSGVSVEADLVPSSAPLPVPQLDLTKVAGYGWLLKGTSSRMSGKDGTCFLGMAPLNSFIVVLAKKEGYAGNRTTIRFNGTSVVVVLQKSALKP
jgi:hypothetical protein